MFVTCWILADLRQKNIKNKYYLTLLSITSKRRNRIFLYIDIYYIVVGFFLYSKKYINIPRVEQEKSVMVVRDI